MAKNSHEIDSKKACEPSSDVQVVKHMPHQLASNREAVLSFAGTLTDAEAANLRHTLSRKFGQLEGEW